MLVMALGALVGLAQITTHKLWKIVRDIQGKLSLVSWLWLKLSNVFSLHDKSTVIALFGFYRKFEAFYHLVLRKPLVPGLGLLALLTSL